MRQKRVLNKPLESVRLRFKVNETPGSNSLRAPPLFPLLTNISMKKSTLY